jgi:hypothetical protein
MSSRIGLSLVVIAAAAAVGAPAAWAAKPKLYNVSLSGEVRNEVTRVREDAVDPPPGCRGSMSETHRFVASAGLAPKPSGVPVASYGRLRFRARLTSPTARSTTETEGSFEPDPSSPPDDPSACAVAPGTTDRPCRFAAAATRASGAEFALLPNAGRYELYYNRYPSIVSCDDELGESLLDVSGPKLTNLRVSAVNRLARGRSVSVGGTATTPPRDTRATGGETLRYTLRVKRVR